MSGELGQILMSVDGAERDYQVAELLGGAMKNDLSFDAKQANIGELNISGDTAAAMKSANETRTRGSYRNSKSKSWGKKKLGAPKQESSKEVWHNKPWDLRRRIRREDAYKAKGGFNAGPKAKVTVTSSIGKPTSTKCYCDNCSSNRKAAAIWFQGGKVGDHPAQAECVA